MIELSIIIVVYKNLDSLKKCLESVPKLPWIEVIVVNNSINNRGFGSGCNFGAGFAKGKYLLFLNPDTIVTKKDLEKLVSFLKDEHNKKVAAVGPLLVDENGKPYLSCSLLPNKRSSLVVYSFLNRIFGNSQMVKKHWFGGIPPKKTTDVGIVSGAVLMIRQEIFNQIGGFDKGFFLYWEEVDLLTRVLNSGYRVVFMPSAAFVHIGGTSTSLAHKQSYQWFLESRSRYFSKHFGKLYSMMMDTWLSLTEEWRFVAVLAIMIIFCNLYYEMGAWLGTFQATGWSNLYRHIHLKVDTGYWVGLLGSLTGMTALYSRIGLGQKWKSALGGLTFGLLLIIMNPVWLLPNLFFSLLWLVADVRLIPERWRVRTVDAWLALSIAGACFAFLSSFSSGYFEARTKDWKTVVTLIADQSKGEPVDVRCLGCTSPQEISPLRLLLKDGGINESNKGKVFVVSLPPFSEADSGITDSVLVNLGRISLSWPLY